jgi:prepilin-type N-terminal cleavage/methylation domain-containing protein
MSINAKRTILKAKSDSRGFTLVEMAVASGIFAVVILVAIGSVISLNDANRKARTIRIATDNISAALDSMTRSIRMGSYMHCDVTVTTPAITSPRDCAMTANDASSGGATSLVFEGQYGSRFNANDQIAFRLNTGRIERSTCGGNTILCPWQQLTAPEITINSLRFFVEGSAGGADQPFVTVIIRANTNPAATRIATPFNVQTTIAVRTPNYNYP